jgi:hypothetical protein
MLHDVTFYGDTVVVADGRRRDLSLFDPSGKFVRVIRPVSIMPDRGGYLDDVQYVSDTAFLAVFRRTPAAGNFVSTTPYRHIVLLNWQSGEVVAETVRPPPLVDSALHRSVPLVTGPSLCVPPIAARPIVAVSNSWSDQLVLLSLPDLATLANVASPIAWRPLTERENRPGELRPPGAPPTIVCGTEYVLVAKVIRAAPDLPRIRSPRPVPTPGIVRARWDFYSYDGQLRYTLEDSLPRLGPDSMLVTTPSALVGNRLYTYSNDLRGYPVVLEYHLDLELTGATGTRK